MKVSLSGRGANTRKQSAQRREVQLSLPFGYWFIGSDAPWPPLTERLYSPVACEVETPADEDPS